MNIKYQPLSKDNTIIGMYLGWVIPETQKWEALLRLTKSSLGYHLNPTNFCIELSKKYLGIPEILGMPGLNDEYISHDIPGIFDPRVPVERKDIGKTCQFLDLGFPDIDVFAFIARTGGEINGDPYSVCPILVPNPDGNREFYCCLGTTPELRERWDDFTLNSKAESSNGTLLIQLNDDLTKYPAKLPAFFSQLTGSIDRVEILNISKPSEFGVRIFAKVIYSDFNPYNSPTFSLFKDYVK
jgi:hypothetical protein